MATHMTASYQTGARFVASPAALIDGRRGTATLGCGDDRAPVPDGPGKVQAKWRDWTIASWAAFTGESGGCPVSTRTTSCAAKSRTVRIASSE